MKTIDSCARAPLACALLLACAGVAAQDPAAVGSGIYKCTMENEHTRVCEVTFAPGAKMASHSHPAHVVYVIQPGKLRITDDATGKAEDHDFKAGDTVWMDPVTHHAENVGSKTLKGIVVEFRDMKGAPMAGRPSMTDVPRTMNEAPPMDELPPLDKPAMPPPMDKVPPDVPPMDPLPAIDDEPGKRDD
ncbi:cupin domain-containing protein [Agrilutibacter solisilvae]|uniref:Cupin domain-containing protein n=1 Tax=Agrilutibacter solisilvae TaxID=2763317 RepID=A0A974XWZ1_9GAMM|nr:cupin domain-containing protein [Lysobacter solisilvae]QSX77357.1 cupin domain-containing protein [Lysobacter solisilvae]